MTDREGDDKWQDTEVSDDDTEDRDDELYLLHQHPTNSAELFLPIPRSVTVGLYNYIESIFYIEFTSNFYLTTSRPRTMSYW